MYFIGLLDKLIKTKDEYYISPIALTFVKNICMIRIAFISSLMIICFNYCAAQYYYKDILNTQNTSSELIKYKNATIAKVKLSSFEADGTITKDFFCEKKISKDYKKTTLLSLDAELGKSIFETYYNEKNNIIKTVDSSEQFSCTTNFIYDENNRLFSAISHSSSHDDDFINNSIEAHQFEYDQKGNPKRLLIIKNQKDTTVILFSCNEKGQVIVEKDTKTAFKYYYYYDDKNHLTDVVHMSEYNIKPTPDYIFEYNSNDEITQMITSGEQKANSMIWKYDYENGLRIKERYFSSSKKYLGKIEYQYQHY